MAAEKAVTIKFIGDASNAQKAFGTIEVSAGKTESALTRIGSTAAGFAIGGALTQLPGILMDGAKGAAEDEAAMLRLRQAVENTGTSYDSMAPAVEDAIANGQKLAFTDGETADALAMLTSLTGDSDEAMRRLSSAQDLARGAGISLEQAAKLLGKTSDENTTALGRLGIQVGENATAQDVLNAVDEKFKGQAGTYAASSAGQMAIAQQNAGELAETFGGMLIPVISLVTGAMIALSGIIQTSIAPAIQGFIGSMAGLMPMLEPVIGFIQENLTAVLVGLAAMLLTVLVPAFVAWAASAATAAAATVVAMAPIIAIMLAVGVAVAALYIAWDTNFLGIQDITATVMSWLQANVLPVLQSMFDGIMTAVNAVRANWDTIWNAMAATVNVVVGLVSAYITSLGGVIETISAFVGGMVSIVRNLLEGDFAGAWAAARDMVSGIIAGIGTIVSGLPALVLQYFVQMASEVGASLAGLAADAAAKAGEIVANIVGGLAALPGNVLAVFVDMAGQVLAELSSLASQMTGKAGEIISGLVSGLVGGISAVVGVAQSIVSAMTNPFAGLYGTFAAFGASVKDGLLAGMAGVVEAIMGVINGIIDAYNKIPAFLRPGSPSKWAIELGKSVTDGLVVGMNQGMPGLAAAVGDVNATLATVAPTGHFANPQGGSGSSMGRGYAGGGAAPSTPSSGGSGGGGAASGSSSGWLAMNQGATFLSCGQDGFGLFQWPDGRKQWLEASFCRGGQTGPSAAQVSHAAGVSGRPSATAQQGSALVGQSRFSKQDVDSIKKAVSDGIREGMRQATSGARTNTGLVGS